VTTLQKICLVALAAFWLASAAWPDGEEAKNAAAGASAAAQPHAKPAVPPLP